MPREAKGREGWGNADSDSSNVFTTQSNLQTQVIPIQIPTMLFSDLRATKTKQNFVKIHMEAQQT